MLQGLAAKKIISVVIKRIMEKSELRKMRKYIEEENELDIAVKDLTKRIKILESNSHPPKEFICCSCGNKAKSNNKGENK